MEGGAAYQWRCADPGITSRYDQPVGTLSWSQQNFSSKILTLKDNIIFILESLTNWSHQVNSRSLLGPCLAVVVYDETWWPMLNVQLSYKLPSSWSILIQYGICPRQFSLLKKFRALVFPRGGYHKEIIVQGIMVPTGVLPNVQSCLIIKWYVMGESVHAPIQRSIYETRWPKHPHFPIYRYKPRSQGPALWPCWKLKTLEILTHLFGQTPHMKSISSLHFP